MPVFTTCDASNRLDSRGFLNIDNDSERHFVDDPNLPRSR